jgi:transcriptional/translational regulatory protein YebC/TACO1
MFDHLSILKFSGQDEEDALDCLLLADVDVVDIENEAGVLTVFSPQTESFKAKQALSEAFGDIDYDVDEIQFIAQSSIELAGEDLELFDAFMEMLQDLDDVQNVYHNVS